jgi:hypothetical protein
MSLGKEIIVPAGKLGRHFIICACLLLLSLFAPLLSAAEPDNIVQGGGGRMLSPRILYRYIAGGDTGLYGINRYGIPISLWTEGTVRKLLKAGDTWVIQGDQGILVSADLLNWEKRNSGLPVKTIKLYQGGERSFITQVQEIKDLEINPADSEMMVCATKDRVFLTRNGGRSWQDLGMPDLRTNGIKAVAAAVMGGSTLRPELTVFLSHSIYGIYYINPDRSGGWTELNRGIETLETTGNTDEVSDIAVVPGAVNFQTEIYLSQSFRSRIYRLDWEKKQFIPLWSDSTAYGGVDSLDVGPETLRFLQAGAVSEIPRSANAPLLTRRGDIEKQALDLIKAGLDLSCLGFWETLRPDAEFHSLSELWLLRQGTAGMGENIPLGENLPPGENIHLGVNSPAGRRRETASGKEGLYLPVNHAADPRLLNRYLTILEDRKLDMVVVDMKDDNGRLRFTPQNPAIAEKGRVFRPVDIDQFLKTMKERGIYTAARIVVFKDPELAGKENGKYAVWNSRTNRSWVGYYDSRRRKTPPGEEPAQDSNLETQVFPADDPAYEIVRTFYDERWVDPYSEEVWEYTALIAEELHNRGFDEIQFDYIRFPTDGDNLSDARYRWRDPGMDMESAMISFLRHVRSRIDAPISVDIYGANGWYRTGARTGQELELMASYVDVISPMYYPSHFEQNFLAQSPPEQRPYRIYFQGTRRTALIGRGQIVVRPYVQAFFLNVSYDRKYYNTDYVRLEVEGVRDAGNGGLTYWNNSGRYDDIPAP